MGSPPRTSPTSVRLVPGPAQWPRHLNAGYFLIWDLTKVVIAQAHGYCLAGGSELASYCDLFVVADDALIGYPPVRDMSTPDNCWFPWHLPMRKAKEMIFTGDPLTGEQAAEYGLANYSVPAEELEEFTTKLAKRVALVPPSLLALSKRQVNRTYEIMGIRTALSAGNDIMALNTRGGPFIKTMQEQGLRAAIDERNARWGAYGPSPLLAKSNRLPPHSIGHRSWPSQLGVLLTSNLVFEKNRTACAAASDIWSSATSASPGAVAPGPVPVPTNVSQASW